MWLGKTFVWTYDDSDWVDLLTGYHGKTITYDYTYYDGQLVYMSVNGSALYFSIQLDGTPMDVSYQETQYCYVTNLRADVTAILAPSGNAVVELLLKLMRTVYHICGTQFFVFHAKQIGLYD